MMHTHPSTPRLCRADGQETLRAAALAEIDQHLKNLKMCVHWLVEAGINVQDVEMKKGVDLPQILVAASPWLFVLFKDDYTFAGQQPVDRNRPGAGKICRWMAIRYGCVVKWEEVVA